MNVEEGGFGKAPIKGKEFIWTYYSGTKSIFELLSLPVCCFV